MRIGHCAANGTPQASACGVGTFGTGIAWLENPPDKIYPDLEAMKKDAGPIEGFVGFGNLSGNWYYFRRELD